MHLGDSTTLTDSPSPASKEEALANMIARFNRDEALKKIAADKYNAAQGIPQIPWIPVGIALLALLGKF